MFTLKLPQRNRTSKEAGVPGPGFLVVPEAAGIANVLVSGDTCWLMIVIRELKIHRQVFSGPRIEGAVIFRV